MVIPPAGARGGARAHVRARTHSDDGDRLSELELVDLCVAVGLCPARAVTVHVGAAGIGPRPG